VKIFASIFLCVVAFNSSAVVPTFTRLTLTWTQSPSEIEGYYLYCGPTEAMTEQVFTFGPTDTFQVTFTNAPGEAPPRRFFALGAFIGDVESDYVFAHWPPYPPIRGTRIAWDATTNAAGQFDYVQIESSTDLITWTPLAGTSDDHFDFIPAANLQLLDRQFFRANAGTSLTLRATSIFQPDPREGL
jgi:hypothetical protein